jgi:class 3 adenylate cyclase/ABC-type phosphate transport system substrate-binding protein
MAASDSLLTPEDQLDFPFIRMTPATAFAVSVIFNVPGVPSLTLPRCVIVDIFKSLVTRWDDPRIQAANPAAVLPSLAIKVTVRATKSGTTEVFTTGLRALEEACVSGTGSQATIAVTSTWALNATIRAAATSSMLRAVQANDGTIGYVASAAAKSLDLPESAIIDETSGVRTSTAPGFVTAAVATGSVNESAGGAFNFPRTANGYPFVGVTYFLVDVDRKGNCTSHRQALEWVRFALSSTTGKQLALETGYVPLTPALEDRALALVDSVRCDGALLFPKPTVASATALLVGIIVAIAVVVAVMVVLQVVRVVVAGNGGRDIANAPCDNEEPFAIAFTDIQSSTALWATVPAEMGPALDTHHLIVRECIARHSGYEVKTIGDAFMVAFREAKDAVEFALELQELLYDGEWPDGSVLDDVYHEVLTQDDAVTGNKKLMGQLTSPQLYDQYWRGLRVRVGVHYGHGDIKLDPVTKAYDYYGTVVNTAARVESVSHGGQVCVSRDALAAAYPTAVPDTVVQTSMGGHELRGLNEPVDLVQLLPVRFAGRLFPDLRLHKAAEVQDSDSTGTPSGTTDTGSIRSLRNSMRSSIGESGLYEALEGFAFTLIPAGTASKAMNAEALVRYNNYTRTLLSSMKAKDRRDVINSLKKSWRIEDDGRSAHRGWATQLGTDAYFTMLLAMRVGPAAESTLSMHPCMDVGQSAFGKSSNGSSMIGNNNRSVRSPTARAGHLSSNGVGSIRRQLKQIASPVNRISTGQRYMSGVYDSPVASPGDSPRMPQSSVVADGTSSPGALTVSVDAAALETHDA